VGWTGRSTRKKFNGPTPNRNCCHWVSCIESANKSTANWLWRTARLEEKTSTRWPRERRKPLGKGTTRKKNLGKGDGAARKQGGFLPMRPSQRSKDAPDACTDNPGKPNEKTLRGKRSLGHVPTGVKWWGVGGVGGCGGLVGGEGDK